MCEVDLARAWGAEESVVGGIGTACLNGVLRAARLGCALFGRSVCGEADFPTNQSDEMKCSKASHVAGEGCPYVSVKQPWG